MSRRRMLRAVLRRTVGRLCDHDTFLSSHARPGRHSVAKGTRVLVVGVYLGERAHTAAHLAARFADSDDLVVEQRWAVIGPPSDDPVLARATTLVQATKRSKFDLLNALLAQADLASFDYVVLSDDDIWVQQDFLPALLSWQAGFDLALAQPARSWNSHTDHLFVLRRPLLLARETHFVECGPLVCLDRRAVRRLLPFEAGTPLWGIDLVWPALLRDAGLKLGIVDAVSVEHTIRPQAATYDTLGQQRQMDSWLEGRRHLSLAEALTVEARHWRLA